MKLVDWTIVTLFVAALVGCQRSTAPPSTTENVQSNKSTETEPVADAKAQAVAAKDALFKRLSTRLMEAMGNGGPAAAIEICSREAPRLAEEVGKEHAVSIGRTSFKLRNPKNSPPEWARPLIEQRAAEPKFVDLPDGRTGALLPIKLKAQCLACHGPTEQIADEVKSQLAKLYPDDQATGFQEGDLRGWFWVEAPARSAQAREADDNAPADGDEAAAPGPGRGMMGRGMMGRGMMGRGMMGRGMMGRGMMAGNREDMTTIHTMFANRDKIRRTVKSLPNGAEAITESDDPKIAALIQAHVPAMEGRIHEDNPLPPMTFHPVFVALRKHADDYSFEYENTDKGVKATYTAEDPFVVMLVREHAKLVSRFIKNGMDEIHKPYKLPEPEAATDAKEPSTTNPLNKKTRNVREGQKRASTDEPNTESPIPR